jgi:hypothetical protein
MSAGSGAANEVGEGFGGWGARVTGGENRFGPLRFMASRMAAMSSSRAPSVQAAYAQNMVAIRFSSGNESVNRQSGDSSGKLKDPVSAALLDVNQLSARTP